MINIFKSPVVLLANGLFPTHPEPIEALKGAGTVICADGSANNLNRHGLIPHVIIGDLDSLNIDYAFNGLKIHDANQSNTDLEKALKFVNINNINEVTILGATGLRDDMTLINLYLLFDYFKNVSIKMITDSFIITCHKGNKKFTSFKGQCVSLFPQDFNTIISTQNLKYELKNLKVNPSASTISNQSTMSSFTVDSDGPILVFCGHSNF